MRVFLAFFLVACSLSEAAPQKCKDQVVAVNNQWFLPTTNFDARQFCTYTFKIPKDSFAVVELEAQNVLDNKAVEIEDDFGNVFMKETQDTIYTENIAVPGNLQIHVNTGANANMLLKLTVTVKKASYLNSVVDTIVTDLNKPSSVIYMDQWKEGTSYILKASQANVNVKVALESYFNSSNLENIFVYDGTSLVGTFYNVLRNQNFVSKSNKVTLFMAKKGAVKGAVLVTDNSNLANINTHEVFYLPAFYAMNVTSSLLIGDATKQGAFTLIGAKTGVNPVTVVELTYLLMDPTITGMKFSVVPGGPVADQSKAIPVVHNSLPMHLDGLLNTFYINKGMGTVKYFVH